MIKYLKAKFIIPALILLLAVILVLMYFVGALHPVSATVSTKEFDISLFTDASEIEDLNLHKLVGKNKNYAMYFNEDTTVVTIVVLDEAGNETDVKYSTAVESFFDEETMSFLASDITTSIDGKSTLDGKNDKDITAAMKSNFVISYLDSNGKKVTSTFNMLDNSVAFKNDLTETVDKHYSIHYIEEERAVQVSYDVGKFFSSEDYFPKRVTYESLEDLLRGNTILIEDPTKKKQGIVSYSGGYCWGVENAKYLEDNGLVDDIYTLDGGYAVDIDDEDQNESTQYYFVGPSEDLIFGYGEYVNCNDGSSPITMNPFFTYSYWTFVTGCYQKETSSKDYVDEDGNSIPFYYTNKLKTTVIGQLYDALYTSHDEIYCDPTKAYNTAKNDPTLHKVLISEYTDETVTRGGFQARDDDGNWLYETDEHGNYIYDDYGHLIPVQGLYSIDIVDSQNAFFAIDPAVLPVFRIAIEFKLTDDGLDATILHNSLKDSSNYVEGKDDPIYNTGCQLFEVTMLPFLTSSFLTDSVDSEGNKLGEIIVPDGSGASIHFNNGANDRSAAAYKNLIYGNDTSHLEQEIRPTESEMLMFPMYGFLNEYENKGTMAVCNSGENLTYIYADVSRDGKPYNQAYFQSKMREVENLVIVSGYYRFGAVKYAEKLNVVDYSYSYNFLGEDEVDYSSLACKYRTYLMNQYGITEQDTTQDHPVIDINFMGAYRHYVLTLGVIYYRKSPLTTFEEATEIIKDLQNEGVTNMNVSYKAWSSDGLEPKLRKSVKTAKTLGSSKDYKAFVDYLYESNIDFYPELNVSFNKGYKYNFGANKYSTRGVGNVITKMYDYDLATLQFNKKTKPSYIVSPKYYMDISENYSSSFRKLNTSGIYLSDLGNSKIGDYHKGRLVYSDEAEVLTSDVFEYWSNDYKIQLNAPFAYALPYASNVVGAPFTTTLYTIVDDTIPFYELVLSGLVDYSGVIINGTDDNSVKWFLAKSIECGANLSFQLSEEDNSVLLETDYTQYYRINYNQWRSTILDMYHTLDTAGIATGKLVKHEIIYVDTLKLSYVEYDNGLKFYINLNNRDVTYNSQVIKAYEWINA